MNNPLIYLFSRTWQYAENRRSIVKFWSMFIIGNGIRMVFTPLAMAKVMDIVQKEGVTKTNFWMLSALLVSTLALHAIFWIFHGPGRVLERMNAFKVKANYRKSLLKGVFNLPLEWHSDHHSGDTIDKIEKGATGLYSFSETSFIIISSLVRLVVSYSMLIYICHSAVYVVFAMLAVTIWVTMRYDRVISGQYRELNRSENNISESVFDAISNITTVIILRVERTVFNAIEGKIDKPFGLFRTNSTLIEWKWFIVSMCCTSTSVAVLGIYFWQHIGAPQGVLIGSVYLLVKYLDEVSDLFYTFTNRYGDILRFRANVMNAEEVSKDFVAESFTNHVLPDRWQRITVGGLNFSYHTQEGADLHLEDVDISIGRGERIAFVGTSGSGKTTLLKIIRDLHHPRTMMLEVDQKQVDEGFKAISRGIALVPQEPEIFARTIRENITLGAEYSEELIQDCIRMACFDSTIKKLPKGLESAINEKGVNLSGGQKQRLALVRGLLACRDKSVILLDEPTSSVDFATEMKIYENIFEGFKGKSVISSVHRLHLLPLFDRVYMFGDGRVTGSGTLQELLKSCPEFRELWQKHLNQQEQD